LNDLEAEIDEKFEAISLSSSVKYKKLAADFRTSFALFKKSWRNW